ncbi:MAG: hypothetical protein C0605_02775 [Hyphomicrobiales bacterium]|nr:MAG: hypothetical protein C0605_02775 [Hyphomicrobiales bacterium]
MHSKIPSRKTLTIAWIALMGFSIATMIAGRVTDPSSLGPLLMLALLMVTGFKSLWILRYYLNLRASTKGWNSAFISFLLSLLTLIYGLYLIPLLM